MFTDNLVFESIFYKRTSKSPLLLELALRLNQVRMRGELVLHVIRIAGTLLIEAVIDSLSRGNNLVGMMRGLNPLQFVPLDKLVVVISSKLYPCISTWWEIV